jgi:hypothetical protein
MQIPLQLSNGSKEWRWQLSGKNRNDQPIQSRRKSGYVIQNPTNDFNTLQYNQILWVWMWNFIPMQSGKTVIQCNPGEAKKWAWVKARGNPQKSNRDEWAIATQLS